MTDKKNVTFNTGHCLIEVASLAGLTTVANSNITSLQYVSE